MKQPQPLMVIDLFPEILDALLDLLSHLSAADWDTPTACASWSVKDIALHLLGGDIGILSRKRDGYVVTGQSVPNWDELVALINTQNEQWVNATRRISPALLCDLLRFTGAQVCAYFGSLNPYALGEPVSWTGSEPAPVWLDLAREYTERWHHQQHIRNAVGRPGLKQPRYFKPVLDTFVRALPHTYRAVHADENTLVALTISGESGGTWFLLKEHDRWNLYLESPQKPHAEVVIHQDVAWMVFTKGISTNEALTKATLLGDRTLGLKVLEMVSIIA